MHRTVIVTRDTDPFQYTRLPAMEAGTYLDIEVRSVPIFTHSVPGNYYLAQITTGLTSGDVGEGGQETYELLVVTVLKWSWTSRPSESRVTQLLHPTVDALLDDVKLAGLTADRLGEWLLGKAERRNIRRRQRDGQLVHQLREAIAAEIDTTRS